MERLIHDIKRSHRCGDLRGTDEGAEVVLMGWVQTDETTVDVSSSTCGTVKA